jgi:hypothetical protein
MKQKIWPLVLVTALTLMGLLLGATLVAAKTVEEPGEVTSV